MVHQLDIANWYLGLDAPQMAASIGDHFQTKDLWETPDTVQTLLRYPDQQTQVYFEGTFASARNAAMIELMGTEATLYLDRGRYEVHPERRSKLPPSELIIAKGPRGADFYEDNDGEMHHLRNWIDCIHSRANPAADVESGVAVAAAAHLANQSLRTQAMAWNDG
jgi:predicted dehydrogenase